MIIPAKATIDLTLFARNAKGHARVIRVTLAKPFDIEHASTIVTNQGVYARREVQSISLLGQQF